MKRLVFLFVGSAVWLLVSATAAVADNGPHVPSADGVGTGQLVQTDRCASCHRAHTAQGQYNLLNAQPGLCFTCHGSGGAGASTDVQDGVGYVGADGSTPDAGRTGTAKALRGGGFEFALIDSTHPTKETYLSGTSLRARNQVIPALTAGATVTSKHDVYGPEGTTYTAWGNGAVSSTASAGTAIALECGSCHDPHGNGNYRILKPIPDASGATTGVTVPDAATKVYVTGNYWATGDSSVPVVGTGVSTPDGFIQNIASWCSTCHTRYLAGSGSYKTDSGDAIFKYRHRSDRIDKVGAANCITCHVAHGSNADMTGTTSSQVTLPDGSTAPAGDSRLLRVDNRGICLMCHNV